MNYDEMIAKALKGRSVNSVAKAWGIPQSRLDRYVRGVHMPDYATGLKIAKEAGVNTAEAFEIFADAEEHHKVKNFKLQMGFAHPAFLAVIAAITMAVTLFLTPETAQAKTSMPYFVSDTAQSLYYVKLHDENMLANSGDIDIGLNGRLLLLHCALQQANKSNISRRGTPADNRRFFRPQRACTAMWL